MNIDKEWLKKMGDEEDKIPGGLTAGCMENPLTFWERVRCRLFPAKHCFAPEAPTEFKDCLTAHTITKLDFVDRIRAMVTGVIVVTTRTVTENEIGRSVTNSTCHIGTARDLKNW